MKRFSCIIFDIDGTLTKTNELIFDSFNHIAQKYLKKVYTPAEIVAMFGPTEEVAIERMVGPDNAKTAISEFYEFYEHHHPALADSYDGIRDLLASLRRRGIILAVFTGKGRHTALSTLEKFQLKSYFDLIVTGSDVVNHKPSAEGIHKVIAMFGLDPDEVLMVGDSVGDVKAAQEAGVRIAAVLWDSYSKESVLQMDVDYQFHSVREFSGWLSSALLLNGETT